MTIIISIKTNDGIVMASDSASTFANGQTYLNADKIVNLVKGLPIGIMVTGAGGIGQESVSTLLKDVRARLDGSAGHPWALNRSEYKMQNVADHVLAYLSQKAAGTDVTMKLRLCGYSAGRPLPEVWDIDLLGGEYVPPTLVQGEADFGPRWEGQTRPLNRIVLGVDERAGEVLANASLLSGEPDGVMSAMASAVGAPFVVPAMPIQDAIDLARWLVDVTTSYVRFAVDCQPKSVGGSVEVAAITKHEGFRWVQRRHFFPAHLNPA